MVNDDNVLLNDDHYQPVRYRGIGLLNFIIQDGMLKERRLYFGIQGSEPKAHGTTRSCKQAVYGFVKG